MYSEVELSGEDQGNGEVTSSGRIDGARDEANHTLRPDLVKLRLKFDG